LGRDESLRFRLIVSKMSKEKNYRFIIVLCAEAKEPDGKFPDFKNNVYLGGQIRMEAALALSRKYPNTTFVLVGGYDQKTKKQTSKKVADMYNFLKRENRSIKTKKIPSLPCTKHNLVAVFNTLKQELENQEIGILTNFYHLPRSLQLWTKLVKEEFTNIPAPWPFCAEAIVDNPIYYMRFAEYLVRLEQERSGLRDEEKGTYEDSCLTKKIKDFEDVIKQKMDILLTKGEREDKEILKTIKSKKLGQ